MDGVFCDEGIRFEHDDRPFKTGGRGGRGVVGRDRTAGEVGIDVRAGITEATAVSRGLERNDSKKGRESGSGGRRSREKSGRMAEDGGASGEHGSVEVSGSSGEAEDEGGGRGKGGGCKSFWYGVVRGFVPVLMVVGCCVKRDEGRRWDERWMGYGTTLGLFLLVMVALVIVLINIT